MIKKFLKGQKGISLITLTIAVMVILVLTNVIILNVTDNLRIERLKALQTDISNLRDKVSNYYAKFGTIPIVDVEYKNINNIKSAGLISEVNDSGRFYVIDLDKIENLTLNYGRDYEKITPSSTDTEINSYTDIYIINSTSHNIFYVKGVKIDNDWYYTDYLAEDIDLAPINLKYIDNVRIPEGFYYVDGKKDTGIIISDVEGDDIQNSKKGNQYVWVPVEDFDEFVRKDFGRQNIADANFVNTEKTASKYYEAVGDGVSAGSEVEQMYRSVKQNKGFYIARFEAGQVSGQVVSKKGENVYSSIKWGNADETGGAVALARNVYPKSADKDVISTLCYGVQWDAIMNWVSKDNNLSKYLTDSSQIGNYSNSTSPAKTGSNDSFQVKNIYDLAGNVGEWTMENYNQNNYVIRGGDFSKTDSNYKTLASRAGGTLDYTNANTGFRVALYLKDDAPGFKMPKEDTAANSDTTLFETDYGRIDVIWLDKDNNVRETPEPPILGDSMEPVTWTETTDSEGKIISWTEDTDAKSSWYGYVPATGTEDNLSSRWANAKNTKDGSYFVWIPRYAYRITYCESATNTEPIGYYDGWGMWKASDGTVKYKLDEGVETVVYNNTKYIVHPAFETNLDNGGWDKDLTGFWFAKYEMSRENSSNNGVTWTAVNSGSENTQITDANKNSVRAVSKPNVISWFNLQIGNCYANAYNYDRTKESHLIKNSEWGAAAYLAHSQYGRNGYELDSNNNRNSITGNGGGVVGSKATPSSDIRNAYNTVIGAKASTTGNVYGIYDMSGGTDEPAAAFNKLGSPNILTSANNVYMTNAAKNASGEYVSSKYITIYSNDEDSFVGNVTTIHKTGKIGDNTKEVNQGGIMPGSSTELYWSWFHNSPSNVSTSLPFYSHGGIYTSKSGAGIFHLAANNSRNSPMRVVLCP